MKTAVSSCQIRCELCRWIVCYEDVYSCLGPLSTFYEIDDEERERQAQLPSAWYAGV